MQPQNILDQVEVKEKRKRPLAVTIVCLVGFAFSILVIGVIVYYGLQQEGINMRAYYHLSTSIAMLIPLAGIWKMKKWGLYSFIGLFVTCQVVIKVYYGIWLIDTLILPVIIIAIALTQLNKMN